MRAMKLGCALCLGLWATAASAQVTRVFRDGVSPTPTYAGTQDVTLNEATSDETVTDADTNYASEPIRLDGHPARQVGLVRYDLSSIPANATVTSVELRVNVTDASTDSFDVFELLVPWNLNEATWKLRSVGVPWAAPGAMGGADRGNAVMATVSGATGARTYRFTPAGVAVVQKWVANPAQNFGMWMGNVGAEDGLVFSPCSGGTASNRQALRVTYNGATTVTFQDGVSPNNGYGGCDDTVIARGPTAQGNNQNALALRLSGSGGSRLSSLIRFDLSSWPAGSTVTAAELELMVVNPSASTFELFAARRPWMESGANWATYDGTNAWGIAGAQGELDRSSEVLGTLNAPAVGSAKLVLNARGLALVRSWLDGSVPNHGFVLSGGTGNDSLVVLDREHPDPAMRPGLVLVLADPPPPSTPVTPAVDAGTPGAPGTPTSDGGMPATGGPSSPPRAPAEGEPRPPDVGAPPTDASPNPPDAAPGADLPTDGTPGTGAERNDDAEAPEDLRNRGIVCGVGPGGESVALLAALVGLLTLRRREMWPRRPR